MDFSKRSKTDVIGAIAALVMVFSLIFLDSFSLAGGGCRLSPTRSG